MSSQRPSATLLAWSIVGLLGGHQLAFALVYRDPSAIAHALADTGHGWAWMAPLLLATAAFVALVTGIRGGSPVTRFRTRVAVLAAIQVGAFLGMEVVERLAHGTHPANLGTVLVENLGWAVLALGVVLQLALAFLLAILSAVVDRIVQALRAAAVRWPRATAGRRPTVVVRVAHSIDRAGAAGPRAPPVPA